MYDMYVHRMYMCNISNMYNGIHVIENAWTNGLADSIANQRLRVKSTSRRTDDSSADSASGWASPKSPGDLFPFDIHGEDNNSTLWLCQNSYGKWQFIVDFHDFPIKNGDFP